MSALRFFNIQCVFPTALILGISLVCRPVAAQQPAVQQSAAPPVQAAPATSTLQAALSSLAKQIADYAKRDSRVAELEVKPYRCDRELNSSAGPGIQKLLMEELAKSGIKNKAGAKISCVGHYNFLSRQQMVSIETQILEDGKPKFEFNAIKSVVSDIENVFALTGATGAVSVSNPEKTKADVVAAVQGKVDPATGQPQPAVFTGEVRKSEALAQLKSPFGVELCRRDPSKAFIPVALETEEGRAYAPLQATDVYAIRVYNRAPFPVAVGVTIDGLNMFMLSKIPAYLQLGKLIIPPQSDHLITGWYETNEVAKEFLVTQLPDALVAKLAGAAPIKNPERVGTVTVSFCAAVTDPNGRLPPDEPGIKSLGTAAGAPVGTSYRDTPVLIGKVREVVSIRYEKPVGLPAGEGPPAIGNPIAAGK